MSILSRYRRMLTGLAITLAVICAGVYLFRDAIFRSLIQPGQVGVADSAPQSPKWLVRPETPPPGAWETPWGVDVFFVHQTTAIWPNGSWNASTETTGEDKPTQRALALYAGALKTAGPIYAPDYRQAVLEAMLKSGPEAKAALDLAYADVLAAFDAYIETDNRQRAVILVGVGQGGLHVARLLSDRFSDGFLRQRLGAAYMIETAISEASLPIPVCDSRNETGCAISWLSDTGAGAHPADIPIWTGRTYQPLGSNTPVCVNPLSWRRDADLAPAPDHIGGVARFDEAGNPVLLRQMVSARCTDGQLDLIDVKNSALRRSALWGWGQHVVPANFNLFYGDLAENIAERARAISAQLDETGPKPAKPLPPVRMLEEAPIHRNDGEPAPLR